jgi:prophage tail gpP-like protein
VTRTYTVKDGDTLERVSTIVYGTPSEVALLQSANPQAAGGLVTGAVLIIPELEAESDRRPLEADQENEVSLAIDGVPFRFWTSITVRRSMDSMDSFGFAAPFEPDNAEFRAAFVPLKFQRAQVFVGGAPLFTGVLVNVPPSSNVEEATVDAQGYALAAVLNDVTVAVGQPIEFNGLTLREISTQMAKPFGLVPEFTSDPGPTIDRAVIAQSGKILPFWISLAQQQNLVIGSTPLGQPLFQRTTTAGPVQRLEEGSSPVRSVSAQFNPQQYYSHVTATVPESLFSDGATYTAANPFLKGVLRPLVFTAGDLTPGEAEKAANAKLGRMFANALSYTVELAGWRDARGDLWRPNTIVRLLAPEAMVYNETQFLVRAVELSRDAKSDTTRLDLILPGAFEGQAPEVLPWDG